MKNFLLLVVAVVLGIGGAAQAANVQTISKEELRDKLGSYEYTILDVRAESHWNSSDNKIPGAIRLPGEQVDIWAENFHKNTPLVLYCACEGLGSSGHLARQLMEKGFTHVYVLNGGWNEWLLNSYPVAHK
ncbi:rhodanese-related (seleno)protein [Candidatus Electrothrix sp.]|uniref:rhodanese-related (seleno)protein n=1 Tax=Candidatus Electrothrix sp. TaxID=2170559 RepID=UPI004056BFD2